MKKFHKTLSVFLCLVMALSFFGLAAFAEDGEEHVHNYTGTVVAPTCAERGYTLYVCSGCGDHYIDENSYTNPLGHNYGEWREVRESTCTEEGLMERECIRCHGKETKTISVIPHEDRDEDGQCDVCGADVEVKKIFSPFEWLKTFIQFLRDWFNGIFA